VNRGRRLLHAVERPILEALTHLEHRPLVRWPMLLATRLADGWALVVLVPVALLVGGLARGPVAIALGLLSAILTGVAAQSIKALVGRNRPTGYDVDRPIGAPDKHAFPSGHTAQAFSMVVVLGWLSPALALAAFPVAVCVGLSRMVFGLHYPSDVVAGAVLGAGVALGVVSAAEAVGLVDWIMRMSPIA
jgi:undecaprenyl-diphosphatase